jgi:hypothetical protein
VPRPPKQQYVAVLPDGTEFFADAEDGNDVCEQAVRKAGLTTPRAKRQKVKVGLFQLFIRDGKLDRRPCGTKEVMPYLERMTENEYDAEIAEQLSELPESFHGFVRNHAYEHGHSSGLEEMLNIASELISNLAPCVKEYATQLHHDR